MNTRVLVSIVAYDSAGYLRHCLDSLKAQHYQDFSVSLWDNASQDETPEIAAEYAGFLRTAHFSNRNIGFCAAHNRIIHESNSDYVLVLNPDVILEPEFLRVLVQALDMDPTAGSASGRLWRWEGQTVPRLHPPAPHGEERILDTTGIYFTCNQRHLDRGSGEPDEGRYDRREYVFGASGAAAFYRRAMLDMIRDGQEYFDEAFFAYREDADLAWRAQWMGWRCLYVPEARGYHVRQVLPERRSQLSEAINMHSFKNRFLLRVKNMDTGTYLRFFLPITARDAGALAYVLTREWSSLRAIPLFFKALPQAWKYRKALRRHRRVSPREVRAWFSNSPVAKPLHAGSSRDL
jgi:GT2 family glycosyltransferase